MLHAAIDAVIGGHMELATAASFFGLSQHSMMPPTPLARTGFFIEELQRQLQKVETSGPEVSFALG